MWAFKKPCKDLPGGNAVARPIAFHRDVSSHNILISFPTGSQSGCSPHLALIDFGFAVREQHDTRDVSAGGPGKSESCDVFSCTPAGKG